MTSTTTANEASTMQHAWYVLQMGYEIFGFGDSPAEAVEMANEFLDRENHVSLETLARYAGTAKPADPSHVDIHVGTATRKLMTDQGELTIGQMVLCDGETAAFLGFRDI